MIHRENHDRRPTDGGLADQLRTIPGEMTFPPVLSWVEQPCDATGLGIDSGDVRSLVRIVMQARQCQVVERRHTAVLSGDDVVDWEWDRGIEGLGHPAVLTRLPCSLSHLAGERWIHGGLISPS